ncbi:hypothetical protein [Paraburkholderia sp. 2C]
MFWFELEGVNEDVDKDVKHAAEKNSLPNQSKETGNEQAPDFRAC